MAATKKQLENLAKARSAKKAKATKSVTKKVSKLSGVKQSAIHKFVYFSFNYPNNFIAKVWKNEKSLATHFQDKFDTLYSRKGANAVMSAFYLELSKDNQEKLEKWITKNYKA